MDGMNYVDHKTPFMVSTGSTISLLATYQPLVPAANLPIMGNNYFNWVGKAVRIRAFGASTSAATPGNFTCSMLYGDGSPAAGVTIGGLQAGWTANLANQSWMLDMIVRCRALGPVGTLLGVGTFLMQGWGQGQVSPFNVSPQPCDLTQPFYLNVQWQRSGSTAETIVLHDLMNEALN